MVEPDEPREFRRRPRSTQATVFFAMLVLGVAVVYALSRSFVGTPPQYDAGPLPAVQERWQLIIPVNTDDVRMEGSNGQGATVWTLTYNQVGAAELLSSTTGPGKGAPLTSELSECGAVAIHLETAQSVVDCDTDLLGQQSAHARQGADTLWVFWTNGAIYLIQYLG